MSADTLANRFRTQRTDRIRVGGVEVLSMLELPIDAATRIEIVIEEGRDDVEQGLIVYSPDSSLVVQRSSPKPHTGTGIAVPGCAIAGVADSLVELLVEPAEQVFIRVWNAWTFSDAEQAWTGNSGIIVEELDPPEGADRRLRMWCSDGLGDATFDDLVCVVTLAAGRQPANNS